MIRMRRARGVAIALLWWVTVLCAGCARCESKVEFESFVTVPTALDAVEKLDDPPDVVVKIEKKAAPKGGGGGCGHSPVCIIIIPFVLADALFPEKLRIATVSEKGRETYHGVFRENGQFVQALALQDGVWRKIALVQLRELGRNIVVELQHAPPDAEGKPGTFERSSLQKQVDLLSGYRAALGQPSDADRRRKLVNEMLTHLHVDAMPVAKQRLLDAAEASGLKQDILQSICSTKAPIGSADERSQLLKELDGANPDAGTSAAALACFDPEQPERASSFTARVVDAACAAKDIAQAEDLADKLLSWSAGSETFRSAVEPFVARCAASERRLYLRFVLRFALEQAELRELASSKDPATASRVIGKLSNLDPSHRAILLEQLERADAPAKSLLLRLSQNGKQPDAEEAKALAGAFIVRPRDAGLRAELLVRLRMTPEDQRGLARTRLEQKLGAASGDERSALAAGLVMLGDREQEAAAARALRGLCPELAEARARPVPPAASAPAPSASAAAPARSSLELAESVCTKKLPQSYWQVESTPDLTAFVLREAGCSEAELLDLGATSVKVKAPERGRVCKGEAR